MSTPPLASGRGAILLGLLWAAWSCYAWLGNQAHADAGILRAGIVVAMMAVFVLALAIPEAWDDAPGGLHAPTVLVVAYLVIRVVHEGLYALAAADDSALRHQLWLNLVPFALGAALLLAGAAADDRARTAIWGAAVVLDWTMTYVTSMRGRGWRIRSVDHFVERHGLVLILALGESVIAIGVGASALPVAWPLLAGSGLGILIATALWWLYFDVSADAAEQALHRLDAARRVRAAIEAYTYLHYWMVFGIIVTAVGIEAVLTHTGRWRGLGRVRGGVPPTRSRHLPGCSGRARGCDSTVHSRHSGCIAALGLVALAPAAAAMPPLAAATLVVVALGALIVYETVHYASARQEILRSHT